MADGVAITAGSGTTILTDDTGAGGHAQVMKLAISTDGSGTLIPADATNGLDVDVTRVSGTVTVSDGTGLLTGSGNLTAQEQAVTLTLTGHANTTFQLTGTWSATVTFEASNDNATWVSIYALKAGVDTIATTATSNGIYRNSTSGFNYVRCRCSAYTSGTIVVTARGGMGTSGVFVNFPLPAGANNIGSVTGPIADDSAFTAATTPVFPAGCMADDTSTDLVDENDVGIPRMTLDRRQIVQLGESGAKDVKGGGSKTDGTDQSIMAAGGAGVYNYLQWVTVYNASATNTYCNVKDGSTVVAVLPLPAYGGCMFMPPRPIRGTANTAFNLAAGASVTTAYLYGGGYTATA